MSHIQIIEQVYYALSAKITQGKERKPKERTASMPQLPE